MEATNTSALLSVEDFGRHLLTSQDLDPIYVALVGMGLDWKTLNRWLLAYWCCYDAGVSSYIADASDAETFWHRMDKMARNEEPNPFGERWRRAAERRHWRGKNAAASLANLRARYGTSPEAMADYCALGQKPRGTNASTSCGAVMKRAKEHTGFGPWIGFKIADMAERVMGVPVSFERAEVFVFKDPAKAAVMAWQHHFGGETNDVAGAVSWAVNYLTGEFADLTAPPGWDRPVALQEVETVLCKWKSHRNGHYPLYNDLREIRAHLHAWLPHSPLAVRFLEAMPPLPEATS